MNRKSKKQVAVIIPVYKELPTIEERNSFCQCLKVLCSYDIVLVCPDSLNVDSYEQECSEIQIERFDDGFFKGIDGYNRLCMSVDFYRRFSQYRYILIYQLDAWVFRDELLYWCEKGYDYIGAPWAYYTNKEKCEGDMWAVGNGGFSLRKISYFIKVLTWKFPVGRRHLSNWRGYIITANLLFNLGWKNTMPYILSHNDLYEDMFFSRGLETSWIKPVIPDKLEALKFSFEKCPSLLFKINEGKLPFGCHAYLRYEYDIFWKNYIK